ncbi:PREDICTED: inhibitor of Bruton tyrosine kinase [Nicrophorus vespilloides]|uniref:Inhibitor of Bruton tyrosine kinase n=1 Tax=Nicrophorus vespilloides TaxID=110193 RepID=A0ABM1MLR2_NICVS|nr:PREDICTED: inhibitor of Bruton tyrosine kinase [Nicrophorus vespilloides]
MVVDDELCSNRCSLYKHGETITSALTKHEVSDAELCSFLNKICDQCGTSKDYDHRSALHVAASCGRTEVCKWLVCRKHSKIDEKDTESGYTALHRSVFYGKIDTAVALIKLGAKINILDCNNLTPLDHALKDNPLCAWNFPVPRWIYMWGTNFNYTLGSSQSKHSPELVDTFHKIKPNALVKKVCLEKYHTAILTENGEIFTYGHGQGGRLGLGSESSNLEPTQVKFHFNHKSLAIKDVCIGRDHCLFLAENNTVWACGSNANFVLGVHPTVPELLVPKPSTLKTPVTNICCATYHSVAWSPVAMYTWGLNGGQIGHDKNNEIHQILPKKVTYVMGDWLLKDVVASNGATAVLTDHGDIFVLHEFQCRKIASKILDIERIKMVGGKLSIDKGATVELRVVALTKAGNLLIWRESDQHLDRAIFTLNRLLKLKDVTLNNKSMILLTNDRELFKAYPETRKKQKNHDKNKSKIFNKFLNRNECILVDLERIPKIFAADTIVSDLEGDNFVSLQMNVSSYITRVPNISSSTMEDDFQNLLIKPETSNFVFTVRGVNFPVHKYIIGLGSDKLKKMVSECNEIKIDSIHPQIFEQLLNYLYTNDCELLHAGPCSVNITPTVKSKIEVEEFVNCAGKSVFEVYNSQSKNTQEIEVTDPVKLLQDAAKSLGLNSLYNDTCKCVYSNGVIKYKTGKDFTPKILKFKIDDLVELHDIQIECKSDKIVAAHKCILEARSEFFRNMFSVRWNDDKSTCKLTLPFAYSTINRLMNYLYMDQVSLDNDDLDTVCNLLVLAEYLLMDRLIEVCEFTLSKMITFKNVLTVISLAHTYNANQLKICCMEFICLNIAAFLESRCLEEIDEEILIDLTKFYATWNRYMSHRIITPYSDNTSDEVIKEIHKSNPVNMDFNDEIIVTPNLSQRKRTKSHKSGSQKKSESKQEPEEKVTESVIIQCPEEKINVNMITPPPARIKAISSAMEKIALDNADEDYFVNLTKGDFPDLNESFASPDGSSKTKSEHRPDKHKMQKVSQKMRKRLSSECSLNAVPESPKNPWKRIEPLKSPIGSSDAKANISTIITEEKKQKENLTKIKSKLLIYTQLEDKAIEELQKFYNVDNISDEVIEAGRVEIGLVAAPIWVHK